MQNEVLLRDPEVQRNFYFNIELFEGYESIQPWAFYYISLDSWYLSYFLLNPE